MSEYPRLSHTYNVDPTAECFYQYVYGENDIFYPHSHDFYEIFLTIEGTVTHLVNGIVQKLPEGSLVFIRPDDTHGYIYDEPENRRTTYINLAFSSETARQLFLFLSPDFPSDELLSCDMPPIVNLSIIEKKRLLSQISELNIVNWQDKKALKVKMRAILADIFTRYFNFSRQTTQNALPLWLSSLFSKMERPENFVAGMDRMISLSGKTREHLARSVKKHCGITLADYINSLRLNYATTLLSRTDTPIIDICYVCGFGSMSYFYRVFKIRHGMSPHQFRESLKR
jgi:AraC family cel operon transcriptional repressor